MNTAPQDSVMPQDATARRIATFLSGVERGRRQPNRREAYHVREALELLEAGRFGEAENAIGGAERVSPLPAHVANLVQTNDLETVEQLRAALRRIQEGEPR